MTISHSHYILTFVDRWYWSINLVQLDARWSRGGTQFNQIITMGYVDDDGYYYCWASRTACNRNWWHQERNENTLKINYRFQVYKHTQHTMTLFFFFFFFFFKVFRRRRKREYATTVRISFIDEYAPRVIVIAGVCVLCLSAFRSFLMHSFSRIHLLCIVCHAFLYVSVRPLSSSSCALWAPPPPRKDKIKYYVYINSRLRWLSFDGGSSPHTNNKSEYNWLFLNLHAISAMHFRVWSSSIYTQRVVIVHTQFNCLCSFHLFFPISCCSTQYYCRRLST